ncbi:sensor histidine kinase [Sunxiuqinia rutila]|uniref:sensor histidine kinase n=1 Tax=Sunxiuqinia rutila TaxID=1397841 RepID=UPI003D35F0EB
MKNRIVLFLLTLLSCQLWAANEPNPVDADLLKRIENKFVVDSLPVRYYSNILIRLEGQPTVDDSLIVQQLVDTLNSVIDVWKVYLIYEGTSNLVIQLNMPENIGKENHIERRDNSREIVQNKIILNMDADADSLTRKKQLYYYLMRSLVKFTEKAAESPKVKGSVFDEDSPEKITFASVDLPVIKSLYAKVYDDRSRRPRKNSSFQSNKFSFQSKNVSPRNRFLVSSAAGLLGMLLAIIYLIAIVQTGVIKNHNYDFGKFLWQGMLVFFAYVLQVAVASSIKVYFLNVKFDYRIVLGNTIGIAALGVISIILIFLTEFGILRKRKDDLLLNTLIPFLTTTFIPALLPMGLTLIMPSSVRNEEAIFGVTVTTILFCSLIGVARTFYIYMSMQSRHLLRKKDVQLAQLSELHKQAELQSLQSKINPHFLYNSLNSIASLATIDGQKTEKMALALSDFFKYSLNKEQKQTVSLKEEMESVETYLIIEKVRFGERLNYEVQLPQELEEAHIPQFLIQPLVENAVKHGLSQLTHNGLIRVVVERVNKQLKIRVFDNGPAFPDEPIAGYGLQSIQEKLNLLYQNKAWLKWENAPEKHILIVLPFSE